MDLNEQQKARVAEWFAAGEGLSEIQRRISAEFGVDLRYLDVRLLVAELPQPVESAGEPESKPAAEAGTREASGGDEPAESGAPVTDGGGETPADAPPDGGVTVGMDAIVLPGALASGDVTFGDGTKGKWYLDQMGRLGMGDLPAGYRPSPADAQLFQQRLVELLRSKGLM